MTRWRPNQHARLDTTNMKRNPLNKETSEVTPRTATDTRQNPNPRDNHRNSPISRKRETWRLMKARRRCSIMAITMK